jgi:hypothetical protein
MLKINKKIHFKVRNKKIYKRKQYKHKVNNNIYLNVIAKTFQHTYKVKHRLDSFKEGILQIIKLKKITFYYQIETQKVYKVS